MPAERTARSVVASLGPVAALVAIAGAVRLRALHQPLLEAHPFRQTQTAFTARIFHTHGISLLHPKLPLFGKPWDLPFEFPLFQAVSTLPMNLGLSADTAVRLTALVFFLVSAVLVYLLVRQVTGDPVSSLAAAAFFCFSPFSLLWARAALIEYLATAASLAVALFGILWWERRRWAYAAAAAAAGVVGMLVKPTTAVWWVLPVVGWALQRRRDDGASLAASVRSLVQPGLVLIAGPGLVAAAWWTRYADDLKRAAPATRWLTSGALTAWTFGTLAQRRAAGNWLIVFDRAEQLLVGRYVWFGLAALALLVGRRRWVWWGVALAGVLPVAVFFNLYVAHDYYLAAVSPAVAILLGAGVGQVAARAGSAGRGRLVGAGLVALWLVVSLWTTSGYWSVAYDHDMSAQGPPLATELRAVTRPSEPVVVVGLDWNPDLLYYADRWGTMLVDDTKTGYPTNRLLGDLRRQRYRTFVANDPGADPVGLALAWPWVAPITPHVYRVVEAPSQLGPVTVAATAATGAFDDAARRGTPVAADVAVPCGTGVDLAGGGQALWLRFAPVDAPAARIVLDPVVAPLPAVAVAVVPRPAGPVTHVDCSGTSGVVITAAVAAPPPGG